jgi:hypothetical protein
VQVPSGVGRVPVNLTETIASARIRSLLMNISSGSASQAACSRWSLTQVDLVLCALPIAVFLSIVSLV